MKFGTLLSKPMVMPNGETRIVQYNKNTKRASWNFNGKRITGEMFDLLDETYFVPHDEHHRLFCLTVKSIRIRYPEPQTYEEWKSNKRDIRNRISAKRKAKKLKEMTHEN